MRYALVKDDRVCNVILWDGEEEYMPEEGYVLYEVPDEVVNGWMIVDNQWVAPEPVVILPPEEDTIIHDAKISALNELTGLGVSEATARTIVGLPPLDT